MARVIGGFPVSRVTGTYRSVTILSDDPKLLRSSLPPRSTPWIYDKFCADCRNLNCYDFIPPQSSAGERNSPGPARPRRHAPNDGARSEAASGKENTSGLGVNASRFFASSWWDFRVFVVGFQKRRKTTPFFRGFGRRALLLWRKSNKRRKRGLEL